MELPVVDFFPTKLEDIPENDNPVIYNDQCLLITGLNLEQALVQYIDDEFGPRNIAKFYQHEDAVHYCEMLAAEIKLTGTIYKAVFGD